MEERRALTDDELEEPYGTPIAETPDPHTGLTPNEEQLDRNRTLAGALDRLHRQDQ